MVNPTTELWDIGLRGCLVNLYLLVSANNAMYPKKRKMFQKQDILFYEKYRVF